MERPIATVERFLLFALFLLPLAASISQGSEADQVNDGPVVFRSEAVLVEVPVIVTEKSGAHVHSLTKDQFRVFQDEKEQKIIAFEEVAASASPIPPPAIRPGEFTNLVADPKQPRAVTIVAIDAINTPFLDQAYGRKELIKFLSHNVDPNQALGMVIISRTGLKVVQGLSSDPAALVKILKNLSGEMPSMQNVGDTVQGVLANGIANPPRMPGTTPQGYDALEDFVANGDLLYAQFQQANAIEATMRAFLDIAWAFSGVSGRKSLIWATGSFPFYMDSPSAVPGGRLSALYERAMDALSQAEVSVYPVDLRGLVDYPSLTDYTGTPTRWIYAMEQEDQRKQRTWFQTSTIDTLKDFAAMTGGRAFYNTNDLAGSFKRATEDSVSYYMLSYYLDTKNKKPRWCKLKVTVQHKDVEVRARNGFFITNVTMNSEVTRNADIRFALGSPFEATGVRIAMRWQDLAPGAETKRGDKKKVAFALLLPGGTVTVGSKNAIDLDFVAVATRNGQVGDPVGKTVKASLSPETVARVRADGMGFTNSLELSPGSYQVRFIVRDNMSGRIGSVSAPLMVN